MTHPSQEAGVDECGPSVIPAGGPRWSPPYDAEAVVAQYRFEPDFGFRTTPQGWASLDFTTEEPDGQVINNIRFFTTVDSTMCYREDVWDAIRGDIDTIDEQPVVGSPPVVRTRQLTVALPRPMTTDEEREAYAARQRVRDDARQRAMREKVLRQQKADATARRTLKRFLNAEQQATLKKGYFDLTGSAGGRYRIYTDCYSGNVRWLKPKPDRRFKAGVRYEEAGKFCGHSDPRYKIPDADHQLAQMLELVTDEGRWMLTAIRQGGEHPPAYWQHLSREGAEMWAYAEDEMRTLGGDLRLLYGTRSRWWMT